MMNLSIERRLSDQLSVYTAEMKGIILGLHWVEEVTQDIVLYFVDLLAALCNILNVKYDREDLLSEILQSLLNCVNFK